MRISWHKHIQQQKTKQKTIFNYYTEKGQNIWTKLSSLGEEPTFNAILAIILQDILIGNHAFIYQNYISIL